MATRSKAAFTVVSNPTTYTSPACRSTCRVQAESLPVLHAKRVRGPAMTLIPTPVDSAKPNEIDSVLFAPGCRISCREKGFCAPARKLRTGKNAYSKETHSAPGACRCSQQGRFFMGYMQDQI